MVRLGSSRCAIAKPLILFDFGFQMMSDEEKRLQANYVTVATQVNPYEIEEAIKLNVAGVSECVVIAVDDETDGQRRKAFIVGQADPNDVIEFVRGMRTYQSSLRNA
ncbi:unnamed protein product [Angiostrongylus costaricensis]|uniref:AMP-binding_C domain-containing protein n=1 Tax=Angiostrongylus costaricensis TaxID=334426 RepID=A0A0R3Q0Z8_ANGCS|nr:unnamed protein product [Angiostrongylus costaricensis]